MNVCKIIFVALLIFTNSVVLAADTNKVEIEGNIDGTSIRDHSVVIDEKVYKLHSRVTVDYSELYVGTRVRCEVTDGRITDIRVLR